MAVIIFQIGNRTITGLPGYFDGRIDSVGFWKRVLNFDERTQLYNSGNGLEISPSITISSPVDYRVYQRNGSNQANITISGTYIGSPTAIEASWNGGAYTTIDDTLTGGTFSGTLSNQTAGQGTLTVRFANDTSTSASKSYIGVGDIFVVAGQSNADGAGFNLQTYSHATLKASMFGNDDNWKQLADPVDVNTNYVDAISNWAGSTNGSVWPLLATRFLAGQNVPVAFVPTSISGSTIANWQRNNSNPGDLNTLYGSMYRRINAVGGIKAVLFWQGEVDARNAEASAIYKNSLSAFANNVYADFGVKVVDAQIGDSGRSDAYYLNEIRLSQQSAWNDGENVLPGPVLYDVNLSDETGEGLVDGLHFKTDDDLQTAANRWWAAMDADFYGGTDGRGPRINSAQSTADKTQITLTFTDETLPLLPASGFGGFTVKDNGVPVSISSIVKIASNQLKITLSSAASGTITVSLGEDRTGTGATVPTDSSTYNLPAEIFVDYSVSVTSAPVLTQISAVATPAKITTPGYTFNSTKAGTITYGGGCTSATTNAIAGDNMITFAALIDGTYICTIKVTDSIENESNILSTNEFIIDNVPPTISDLSPDNSIFPVATTSATISLSTNETANCKYATAAGTDYDLMTAFNNTNSTNHNFLITGFTSGTTYHYYFKCKDTALNETGESSLSFSVAPVESNATSLEKIKISIGKTINKFKDTIHIAKNKFKLKQTDPNLANGQVKIYKGNKLWKTITIDAEGAWSQILKLKDKFSGWLKIRQYDQYGTLLSSNKAKIKVDKEKPIFTKFITPYFNISKGDRLYWEATDNQGIDNYKTYFNGYIKNNDKAFYDIPKETKNGLYTIRVKAYDKAGNIQTKQTWVRVVN